MLPGRPGAATGDSSDRAQSLTHTRIDNYRDGAVIDERDLHVGGEFACLDRLAELGGPNRGPKEETQQGHETSISNP